MHSEAHAAGGCLCGAVRYEVARPLREVRNEGDVPR
jgi:hypothetical protein